MHAVVLDPNGGQQLRVKQGQCLRVERINTASVGDKVVLDKVILLSEDDSVEVGTPYLEGAKVEAVVIGEGRSKKIKILKFKRRKHHMKQMGHRQNYSEIKITGIQKQATAKKD